ncbi:molybdopterin-dependent oxidoreductase (plasmid) [Haloferacaceae archaeon DSL9]
MKRPGSRAAVSALAGFAAVAGSFAVSGLTPSFVAAPVGAFVVATTPAAIVAFAIEELGFLGETLAFAAGVALTVGLFAVANYLALLVSDAGGSRSSAPSGVVGPAAVAVATGLLAWYLVATVRSTLAAAIAATGFVLLASTVIRPTDPEGTVDGVRRRVLALSLGVLGFGVVSYLFGSRQSSGTDRDFPTAFDADVAALRTQAAAKELAIEGIPGLVSEIDEFFEVDINSVDPTVRADDWILSVTGEVASERTLTYDELVDGDVRTAYDTLRCVGEQLNSTLLDNAIWTVVPVAPILERAQPAGGCECVMVRAADGYYQQFPLAAMERGYLAFGMNGEVLPREHGYPVRLLIPGHWGEINVKWVTEVEILDEAVDGYWEERGWNGTGPVNTIAKLWTVTDLGDGRWQVGGHAYAGIRGIETVEVSTDGGDSWTDAELSEPLDPETVLGERDAWRQWRYTWEPPDGETEVVVRAIDGEGTVQPREEASPFPNGSSGWVRETISV